MPARYTTVWAHTQALLTLTKGKSMASAAIQQHLVDKHDDHAGADIQKPGKAIHGVEPTTLHV